MLISETPEFHEYQVICMKYSCDYIYTEEKQCPLIHQISMEWCWSDWTKFYRRQVSVSLNPPLNYHVFLNVWINKFIWSIYAPSSGEIDGQSLVSGSNTRGFQALREESLCHLALASLGWGPSVETTPLPPWSLYPQLPSAGWGSPHSNCLIPSLWLFPLSHSRTSCLHICGLTWLSFFLSPPFFLLNVPANPAVPLQLCHQHPWTIWFHPSFQGLKRQMSPADIPTQAFTAMAHLFTKTPTPLP